MPHWPACLPSSASACRPAGLPFLLDPATAPPPFETNPCVQVALCAAHYSLLAPCAEGLLSLLFPFVWQGAYIPVMPFNMKDVLEVRSAVIDRFFSTQRKEPKN